MFARSSMAAVLATAVLGIAPEVHAANLLKFGVVVEQPGNQLVQQFQRNGKKPVFVIEVSDPLEPRDTPPNPTANQNSLIHTVVVPASKVNSIGENGLLCARLTPDAKQYITMVSARGTRINQKCWDFARLRRSNGIFTPPPVTLAASN